MFRFSRVKYDPLLTPQSNKNTTRIFIAWFVSAYAVALIVNTLELSFKSCGICTAVADWVPSILVMAQGSHAPDAMRFVLLYHTISAPVWLILMWKYASDFRRYNMQWWGYPFTLAIYSLAFYISVYGLAFGGADAKGLLGKSYHHSLIISTMITTAGWFLFLNLTYVFWFYLVFVRFYQWVNGKLTTNL